MTAAELPVGARFTFPLDGETYMVTAHTPGHFPDTHLTTAILISPWIMETGEITIAGHTEVIAHPDTRACNSILPQCDP